MNLNVEYSEVPNVDFAEFNNILHKLSIKEIIFNLSTDELSSVIFKFILLNSETEEIKERLV
jgi:hypothetical protein